MIEVRQARREDAASIAAIARDVYAMHVEALPGVFHPVDVAPTTPAETEGLIVRAGPFMLVATDAERVVGYTRVELVVEPVTAFKRGRQMLHVIEMGVASNHRRRGIGASLLAHVRAIADDHAVDGISLDVYGFNSKARTFYMREGFSAFRERLELPLPAEQST